MLIVYAILDGNNRIHSIYILIHKNAKYINMYNIHICICILKCKMQLDLFRYRDIEYIEFQLV